MLPALAAAAVAAGCLLLLLRLSGDLLRAAPEVVARRDGQGYPVRSGPAGAELLALLNIRIVELLRRLRLKYLRQSPPAGGEAAHARRAQVTARLLERYNPDGLVENPYGSFLQDTAFTVDKGRLIAICLRGSPTDLHDGELLTFVALHELAHLGLEDSGHPAEFWTTFAFLLSEAREAGLGGGRNYARRPALYCGRVAVDYNPLYDPAVPRI